MIQDKNYPEGIILSFKEGRLTMKKLFECMDDNCSVLYTVVTDGVNLYRMYADGSMCPADFYDFRTARAYEVF